MQACKICFLSDVRMITLPPQEKQFLENSFISYGVTEELTDNYSVCYQCKALLSKSCNFIQKALKAHQVLLMYKDHNMDDSDMLTWIRNEWNLNSMLSYHTVDIDVFLDEMCADPLSADKIKEEDLQKAFDDLNSYDNDEDNVTEYGYMPEVKLEIDIDENYMPEIKNNIDDNICDLESNKVCTQKRKSKVNKPVDKNTLRYSKRGRKITLECNKQLKKKLKSKSCTENEKPEATSQMNTKNTVVEKNKHVIIKSEKNMDKALSKRITKKKKVIIRNVTKKKKKEDDEDFTLDTEPNSDSSEDSYDDNGKPQRNYPRQCDHCDEEIQTGIYHYKHYLISHSHELYPYKRPVNHRFVCQHCGKGFETIHRISKHEATHGDKTVPCPICNKKFFTISHVRKHNRVVHREMSLFCDFCNKGFRTNSDLKLHRRIHTGDKPFKCHICPAAFAHLGNRNTHLKSHHKVLSDNEIKNDITRPESTEAETVQNIKVQKKIYKKRSNKNSVDL